MKLKSYPQINYNHRPDSYWPERRFRSATRQCVSDPERRHSLETLWRQGRWHDLASALQQENLTPVQRRRFSRIHPALLGGEFLLQCEPEQVEIARIELCSTTHDVISIRAGRTKAGLYFTIADEYETQFELSQETSLRPLSLRELITLLDDSTEPGLDHGLSLGYNRMNAAGRNRRSFRHFTSISSAFYPQLHAHYENVFEEWVNDGETAEVAHL